MEDFDAALCDDNVHVRRACANQREQFSPVLAVATPNQSPRPGRAYLNLGFEVPEYDLRKTRLKPRLEIECVLAVAIDR
jgi:hypothetical protein